MLQKHLILQVVEIIYLLALVDLILSAIRYFQSDLLLQLVDWIMLPTLDLDFVQRYEVAFRLVFLLLFVYLLGIPFVLCKINIIEVMIKMI